MSELLANEDLKCTVVRIDSNEDFQKVEKYYRRFGDSELIPFAKNTPLAELNRNVIPDREGHWANSLFFCRSEHRSDLGRDELSKMVWEYLREGCAFDLDVLSIISSIENGMVYVMFIVRLYHFSRTLNTWPRFNGMYDYIRNLLNEEKSQEKGNEHYEERKTISEEEQQEHKKRIEAQNKAYDSSNEDIPFLNAIDRYEPAQLYEVDPLTPQKYDLMTKDRQIKTIAPYEKFIEIFHECMRYITSIEKDSYYNVIRGIADEEPFMNMIEAFIVRKYVDTGFLKYEDVHELREKLYRSLFQLYIVQDLIDDPEITDIKITSPDSIRVRVGGKAYLSNITFIDNEDYFRFITSVAIKNNIDLKVPTQTFTDRSDPNYILRFTITASYITPDYPILHVRKVARKKLMANDLIKMGFFDEKIRDYLIDCGKNSSIVFAGPPGSGKTVALNWFLEEAYEDSAEILVIQENDELFCYRKGVMFEHVVNNPVDGEQACSLEQLGQMALVAGANVFVIGEAKGAEICSAITLSNSGCRTAITIHSPSSTETIDKMADLAMRGYAQSYEQAVRMMKSFDVIVYLQDFKVQEISRIIGYDEEKKKMKYKYIYRREGHIIRHR